MDYKESFQYIDFMRALNQNRFLAALPTGSGKSWILAALYQHLKFYGEIDRAIVLTSSIGILNLKAELQKLGGIDPDNIFVIDSISNIKDRAIFDSVKYPQKILIMGYDTFRIVSDYYDKIAHNRKKKVKYKKSSLPLAQWIGNKKGILFLDECHLLGNPNSLRTQALFMNLDHFEYRYLLSATPADKKQKFYTILKVLDESLVNGLGYINWASQYTTIGNRWSKYAINEEDWNLQKWAELQDLLYKKYAVKRDKSVLGIPQDYDIPTIYIEMTPEHRKIYEAFSYQVINDINTKNSQNNAGLVANLTNTFAYLQLGCDNPNILLTAPKFKDFPVKLQDAIKAFNYQKSFKKLSVLNNIIEEECTENNNKIIIFYYHPKSKDELLNYLSKDSPFCVSSDLSKEERFATIEKFKKSNSKILIASIMIANTSISLNECKATVFYENTWSYIDYFQARGRNVRIGQDEEVRLYHLRYQDSCDLLQQKALETKGGVLDALIKKNILTPDQWKMIFNGNSSFLD